MSVVKLRRTMGEKLQEDIDALKPEYCVAVAMKDNEVLVQAVVDMPPAVVIGMLEMAKHHFIERAFKDE